MRSFKVLLLGLTLFSPALTFADKEADVSIHFKALFSDFGGADVIGVRGGYGLFEGFLSRSNSSSVFGVGVRKQINRNGMVVPQIHFGIGSASGSFFLTPGVAINFAFIPIGQGKAGIRLDNYVWVSLENDFSVSPNYTIGFVYMF